MHTGDGWKEESFIIGSPDTLDEKLKGRSFNKAIKENQAYTSEIIHEEKFRNLMIVVKAIVLIKNDSGEHKLTDVKFFEQKPFMGKDCEKEAADYVVKLKKEIDLEYFSN